MSSTWLCQYSILSKAVLTTPCLESGDADDLLYKSVLRATSERCHIKAAKKCPRLLEKAQCCCWHGFHVINPRIIECFGLEGTFRGHLAQPPIVSRNIFSLTRLLRALSNLALSVSRDGASN